MIMEGKRQKVRARARVVIRRRLMSTEEGTLKVLMWVTKEEVDEHRRRQSANRDGEIIEGSNTPD